MGISMMGSGEKDCKMDMGGTSGKMGINTLGNGGVDVFGFLDSNIESLEIDLIRYSLTRCFYSFLSRKM